MGWLDKFDDIEVHDPPKDTKDGYPRLPTGISVFKFIPTFGDHEERIALTRFYYNKHGVKARSGRSIRRGNQNVYVHDFISVDMDKAVELAEAILKVCGGKEKRAQKLDLDSTLDKLGI